MKIGCALLAAGLGKRFGGGKLLYQVDGEPMITRALRLFANLPFDARVCVTSADEIEKLARASCFTVAVNPDPARGVGTSVAIATDALIHLEPELDGILFAVSDQPYLTQNSVEKLTQAFIAHPDNIVSLGFGRRRGNPAIFPKALFSELMLLSEDTGGGAVIKTHPDLLMMVDAGEEKELEDIDTRKHYAHWDILKECAQRAGLSGDDVLAFQRSVNEEKLAAVEECLDILLNELSKNGLDQDSEPNSWGFAIEEAISVFAKMQQRLNDKETEK